MRFLSWQKKKWERDAGAQGHRFRGFGFWQIRLGIQRECLANAAGCDRGRRQAVIGDGRVSGLLIE
ncbi:MAG: hypothetical protein Rhob2KO_36030 [Rhodopirellula baltica]